MVEKIILRKAQDTQELVLDMMSTPDYILKSVDWGPIPGTHHSYKYVNQVGVSITSTTLEVRPITIDGWIVADNETHMSELKKNLNSFINPQESIDLHYKDYIISFVPDESVRYSISAAENNEIFSKFQIKGSCPNPLFSDIFESSSVFVETTPSFHFPLVLSSSLPDTGIVFGKRIASLIANVENKGAISTGMRIIFKANGTVVNPSLINVNTLEKFVINKTLVAGEEVEANTNIGEKKIRGRIGNTNYTNYYMYKDIDSTWLQLAIGTNLFRYGADEGINNLDVFVYFYNHYLEVQECN